MGDIADSHLEQIIEQDAIIEGYVFQLDDDALIDELRRVIKRRFRAKDQRFMRVVRGISAYYRTYKKLSGKQRSCVRTFLRDHLDRQNIFGEIY